MAGDRLNRIVTKSGDQGVTGLAGGRRVAKNHTRIHAMGVVDELSCAIGVLISTLDSSDVVTEELQQIQQTLFNLGAELSLPDQHLITNQATAYLEQCLNHYLEDLTPLREFILPGGVHSAAHAHMCRSIARRAERDIISLQQVEALNPQTLVFLNRLSDYFFVLARALNKKAGVSDIFWQKPNKPEAN